jgi:hypothetical protein
MGRYTKMVLTEISWVYKTRGTGQFHVAGCWERRMFQFLSRVNTTLATSTVAVRSKAWVYGRSLTGIAGSNPA